MIKLTYTVLVAAFTALSQDIYMRGKVTDTSGVTPIADAIVTLEKSGISAKTRSDGSFTLSGAVTGIQSSAVQAKPPTLTARAGSGDTYGWGFYGRDSSGSCWSTTESGSASRPWMRGVDYEHDMLSKGYIDKNHAFSVRLVRDY